MTNEPLEDPRDYDRKYAAIAISCINLYRQPRFAVEIRKGLREALGRRLTPEDLDLTIKWLEDNSQ